MLLYFSSIVLYFWCYYRYRVAIDRPIVAHARLKIISIIALLTLPVNFDGHVVTVFGNAVGEKSVWSVASLYQKAERLTFTFVAPLTYQESGLTAVVMGIPSVQNSEHARLGMGIVGSQRASGTAQTLFGLAIYQQAGEKERWFASGFELKAAEEKK